jgi:hypothetical protein
MSRYAADYVDEFSRPKIVYPDIAKKPEFAYDTSGALGGNTMYIIPTSEMHLLAILNSPVIEFFYNQISSTIRGDYLRFIAQYMSQLPIPSNLDSHVQSLLEKKANELLEFKGKGSHVQNVENQINQLVYQLYGLTDAEIALVEAQMAR